MKIRTVQIVATQLFILALAHPALGQIVMPSPAQDGTGPAPYTLHVKMQAVVLDVVVTNKKGQVVSNLGKDDFTVYENRVPQAIKSIDYSKSELPPPNLSINSTAQLDRQAPNAPVNIIVLDDINTLFEDEAFARYSLKKFMDTQGNVLPPTMLVAVNLQRFMVLQDYTTSKSEIVAALEHHLIAYPWQVKNGSWKAEQFNAAFNSLMEVAQATSGHPGHKTMIWMGRGFPTINPQGLPDGQAAALKAAVETCTNALRDARVVLYTLDPAGISSEPPPEDNMGFSEDDPLGGQVDFNAMAKATGGQAFRGRNDVDKLIATSATEGSEFYTLSYIPAIQTDDAKPFRNIRVVMKDPSLRAVTRTGYYTQLPAAPAAAQEPDGKLSGRLVYDLTVAGQGLMVYDAVPLSIVRDTANADNFLIRMKTADIPWKPDDAGHLASDITVLVESFDRKGKLLDRAARVATVQVPEVPGQSIPSRPTLSILQSIPTKAPAARIRFVVRLNTNGKIGTENFFLVDQRTLSDPNTGLKGSH